LSIGFDARRIWWTPRCPNERDGRVRLRALLAWSSLYGTISFELFGHFVGSVSDLDRGFDRAMTELARMIGF
jgi:hypothetical protein